MKNQFLTIAISFLFLPPRYIEKGNVSHTKKNTTINYTIIHDSKVIYDELHLAAIGLSAKAFDYAYKGILQLPASARFGVYVAYQYYFSLFKKIRRLQPKSVLEKRVRVPEYTKIIILAKAGLRHQLNIL